MSFLPTLSFVRCLGCLDDAFPFQYGLHRRLHALIHRKAWPRVFEVLHDDVFDEPLERNFHDASPPCFMSLAFCTSDAIIHDFFLEGVNTVLTSSVENFEDPHLFSSFRFIIFESA